MAVEIVPRRLSSESRVFRDLIGGVRVQEAGVLYHGSPLRLRMLRKDSTITPFRELARVFAHKPTIVSIDDLQRIKHNGVRPGYLYVIDEPLGPDDVRQHPTSVLPKGWELLANRELRLRLVARVRPYEAERL